MIELKEVQDFVKDKNILLVGNSDTIVQKDNSKVIDSYDVVVRMNHGTPRQNIGKKTDIWVCFYSSKARQLSDFKCFNPKYVLIGYADGNALPEVSPRTLDFKMEWVESIQKYMSPSNPSTGLSTLFFFLNQTAPNSITLIGFDFFKTKSFYNHIKVDEKWHNGMREEIYIESLAKEGKIKIL